MPGVSLQAPLLSLLDQSARVPWSLAEGCCARSPGSKRFACPACRHRLQQHIQFPKPVF